MNRKQYLLLVVLTLVAGLIGGAVSNWIFVARSAVAQETEQHKKIVMAEEFRLVDKHGRRLGRLGVNEVGESQLSLFDQAGIARVMLGTVSSLGFRVNLEGLC